MKKPHSHPAHRNLSPDQERIGQLEVALQACVNELMIFADDANCDHSVGLCACGFHRAVALADAAGAEIAYPATGDLARKQSEALARTEKFIADLV